MTASILEALLNLFELVGLARAERDIGVHLVTRRRGVWSGRGHWRSGYSRASIRVNRYV